MKSVDTNVLVRVFTKDDPVQTPLAADALRNAVFVSHGVIMETEWVLRARYGWTRDMIATALNWLLNVNTVSVPDRALVSWSVERYAAGADLSDMLHIVASRGLEAFLTFESKLAEAAGPNSPTPIQRLG